MGSQSIEAGKAFLRLLVDDKEFRKGLDGSLRKLDAFGKSIQGVGLKFSIAGAAMTAPFVAAIGIFSRVGDELKDMATRTGLSVEALSELRFAAARSNTSIEAVERAIRLMQKTIGSASGGNKSAAAAFADLNISLAELQRLTPEQQFNRVAKAVAAIRNPTLRAAAALKVFGRGGAAILPLVTEFDELQKRFEKLGLTISTDTAKAADAFSDSMTDLKFVSESLAINVGAALAPALTKLAESLAANSRGIIEWVKNNRDAVIVAAELSAAILALGNAFVVLGTAIRVAAFAGVGFKKLASSIAAHPYIAATAAIAAMVAWLIKLDNQFSNAASSAKDFGDNLGDAIQAKLDEILRIKGELLTAPTANLSDFDKLAIQAIQAKLARAEKELADLRAKVAPQIPVSQLNLPAFQQHGVPVPPIGKGRFANAPPSVLIGGLGGNLFFKTLQDHLQGVVAKNLRTFRDGSGFKVGEGKALEKLVQQSRASFGGRLAGQIFGGGGAVDVPKRQLKEAEKQTKKLDGIKASIDNFGPGFKIGIA
jgi:hypothetical protein